MEFWLRRRKPAFRVRPYIAVPPTTEANAHHSARHKAMLGKKEACLGKVGGKSERATNEARNPIQHPSGKHD